MHFVGGGGERARLKLSITAVGQVQQVQQVVGGACFFGQAMARCYELKACKPSLWLVILTGPAAFHLQSVPLQEPSASAVTKKPLPSFWYLSL
jgi:hypothetical protein